MSDTVALWCATAGCYRSVAPGGRHCPRCQRTASSAAAQAHPAEPTLFDTPAPPPAAPAPVRASLPEDLAGPISGKTSTSRKAAEGVRAAYRTRKHLIHVHIQSCGAEGATRPEIATALGVGVNSVNSACNTLYRQGMIGSNPEHERPDPISGSACAVLVDEAHVLRWQGTPRRERSAWHDVGLGVYAIMQALGCDLVHPVTGAAMTEKEREALKADAGASALDEAEARASAPDEPGNPADYGHGERD